RLNLCVPGGKPTARLVKQLYSDLAAAPKTNGSTSSSPGAAAVAVAAALEPGRSRDAPVMATFISRLRLNHPESEKSVWHVEFDLSASGLDYTVGDSFGVFPANDTGLVAAVLRALGVKADEHVDGRSLVDVLTNDVSLAPAPDGLFELFSYITGGPQRRKAQALAAGEDPDGDADTCDVLEALHKFAGARPHPEAFLEALDPLQPRLYSIASSLKTTPGRVALTIDTVRYQIGERTRLGVASTFLNERADPGRQMKVYVQAAHGFALPADPSVPIIMIGPGTGVAPFRAFLHERMATDAPGENWLFFGHRRMSHDFLYEQELRAMERSGVLTRLSLAWSRDGDEKFYVQDRMRQSGRDLWKWLTAGAHLYVCGDAARMAKDVERALVDIVAEHGGRSADDAVHYVSQLKKAHRYQQDVY
ncbi:MAG TPA: sulfite reductase subunit alpha, partial [Acidimicrobiia bacterium]|nr:sulfite reductase subunit alpha [Acidimicrobiia bacterium]